MADEGQAGVIADLARARFGSETRVVRSEPLAGDASTRRYTRVSLSGGTAPPTAVAMLLSDLGVALSSEELAVFEEAPAELPFLNVHRFLERIGVAVPAVYGSRVEEGVVLLEDVGDLCLREAAQGRTREEVVALFDAAIEQLVLLQVRGTREADPNCVAFRQNFDRRLFLWELEHFLEYGLPAYAPGGVRDGDLKRLRGVFDHLAGELDRLSRVLNHRDFHGWNLFVHDGRIRVIDFQDALLAPGPYDLATLLGDRDTRDVVPPPMEQELIERYRLRTADSGGRRWSRDELQAAYVACALQKAFKVVGRFHYLARVKGKDGYLRYLPPTLRQLRRLCEMRDDGAVLRGILGPYIPELA